MRFLGRFATADGRAAADRCRRALLLAAMLSTVATVSPPARASEPLDLTQYQGKVVVLDFWASWCVPCRRSFPWLNAMHDKYGPQGLVIIGVNLDSERAAAEEFLQEFPPQFQIYFDVSKDLARSYDVVAMPSSYLLGPNGDVVNRHYGFKVKQQDEYEAHIIDAIRLLE